MSQLMREASDVAIWKKLEGTGTGGAYQVERLDCDKGFSLIESKMMSKQICKEFCQYEGKERILVIAFGLNGHSEFNGRKGKSLLFHSGKTTISIFQAGEGQRIYVANEQVHQIRLAVAESTLRQYIGEERSQRLFGSKLAQHESFRQLAFASNIQSEHLCWFKKAFGRPKDELAKRIAALNLLSDQLNVIEPKHKIEERLSPRDLNNLEYIEEYICNNLDQPINNTYLCMKFALSEYKLKASFNRVHGISPGRFILNMRMIRGHELLDAGYRVSEVAYKVGYQHPNNFTAAFMRFYGYSPKQVYGRKVID